MTIKGGTIPACAACKYQRRRCSSMCPLAPYFPATQPHIFQNAHKLFGVANIMKILNKMNTQEERDEAMKSIKFESYIRERFPVDGCVGYIHYLRQQLVQCTQEYFYVCSRLAICKEESRVDDQLMDSELQLGVALGCPISVVPHHQDAGEMMVMMPYEVNNNPYPMDVNLEYGNEIKKQLLVQDLNYDNDRFVHDDRVRIQMQMEDSQPFQTQEETELDYNDMPFYTLADDRKSDLESKEACGSSCGSAWKDTPENVSKNELRSAAACFHLTSVN